MREWKLDGGRFVEKRPVGGFGQRFHATPDDRTLIGGFYSFSLWEAAGLTRRTKPMDRRNSSPVPQVLSPDGRWLVRGGETPAVTVHDITCTEPRLHAALAELDERTSVSSLALSPDGNFVAVAADQTNQREPIRLFRVIESALKPLAFPHITGSQVRFSPDGRTLAVAGGQSVTLVELANAPTPRRPIELGDGGWGSNLDVLFTPDGARVVTLRERTIGVWGVGDGKKIGQVEMPSVPVSVGLAPDGRHVAVGNPDGTVFVLRLRRLVRGIQAIPRHHAGPGGARSRSAWPLVRPGGS
ncbi:MAG TPA: hypothetical protein VMZ71_05415 [Gemmataceae bacterium]|nr:hypothetical protein [Gemmataceae bacterium]